MTLPIEDYSDEYGEAATRLESLCVQGKKIKISFNRDDFAARYRSYEEYSILCGFDKDRLIALGAGALKNVKIRDKYLRAGYIYDLRTHPSYRKKGIATEVIKTLESKMEDADFFYTFVISDNEAALKVFKKLGYMNLNQFNLLLIPTFKMSKVKINVNKISLEDAKKKVEEKYSNYDFFCEPLNLHSSLGYVSSYEIPNKAFCSIWTNEKIMQEKVIDVPISLKFIAKLNDFISYFFAVPYIPKEGESVRSWIIFDFYAKDNYSAEELLSNINNLAVKNKVHYAILPIQSKDRHYEKFKRRSFTQLDFSILQKNERVTGDVYFDVRDL